MVGIDVAPEVEEERLGESLVGRAVKDGELLVGGRVDVHAIAIGLERILDAHCHVDGVAGQSHVEVVGEERFELDAQ